MAHRDLGCAAWICPMRKLASQRCEDPSDLLFTAGASGFEPAPERVLMPGQDNINSSDNHARNDGIERPRLSRRSILRGAAGAGAAGIAATTLAGTAMPAFAATSGPAHDTKDGAKDTDTSEQIVVHVRDASSGEIDVFRGTSQTRLRDPELAARLVRASR